jgi:hypothetical protein
VQEPLAEIAILGELFEVWNPLGIDGTFVFFRGYIDESYDPKLSQVFTLSCLISTGKIWSDFARSWKLLLDSWNRKLKRQGRPKISRYHATYCSNFRGEFEGWSKEEQREFFADILKIFRRHQVDTIALSVNLDDFDKYFPEARKEAKPDFETFLYGMTTKFLIGRIADRHCAKNPANKIALIHDGCQYSGVMFDAFNQQKQDPFFEYKDCFTTFAASDWKNCVLLQPADLVAYENFKDAMRKINSRDRRISYEMLIDLDAFSGRAQSMDKEAIIKLREGMMTAAVSMGIAVPTSV